MKRMIYVVLALASVGITGSTLLADHINLFVGLLGYAFTIFLTAYALEVTDFSIKN